MIHDGYETKDMKMDYKSKDKKIAEHPSGHIYTLSEGQTDEILKANGLSSVTEAKKLGWKFYD